MSTASKCDKCENLFEPEPGCVTLDVHVVEKEGGSGGSWSGVDFCPGCSGDILKAIGSAIKGLKLPKKPRPPAGKIVKEGEHG